MSRPLHISLVLVWACIFAALSHRAAAGQLPPTTTVITHGFTTGSKGVWVQTMAQAILARAGEGSLYRYEGSTGRWTYVPTPQGDGTSNTMVLIFNWVPESASPSPGSNWNYAQAAADALYAILRSPSPRPSRSINSRFSIRIRSTARWILHTIWIGTIRRQCVGATSRSPTTTGGPTAEV